MTDGRTRKWTKEDHELEAAEAVVKSFPEVSIVMMRDAPDADLLHRDGSRIGLEIVRLADERELSLRDRLMAASERIHTEMIAQHVQGVYRIYYDIQQMFDDANKKSWDRTVPKAIATFFRTKHGDRVHEPELVKEGITGIARIDVEDLPRTFVGCGWSVSTAPGNTLAEIALASKQQKLERYRANQDNAHFNQYWLAMASLGPGTVEDGGYALLLERRFNTDYDRVLLLQHESSGRLSGAQDITPTK